jgi:hypothetical protein
MKHITVVFKNAIQVEGSLISLDNNEMVLQSLDGFSSTVIPDIKESVLFYKVNTAQEVFSYLAEKPNKTKEDLEKLVQARGDMNAIERSSLKDKMQLPVTATKKDPYVPLNQSFPRTIEHTQKKTVRADTSFSAGLQGMFSKKH